MYNNIRMGCMSVLFWYVLSVYHIQRLHIKGWSHRSILIPMYYHIITIIMRLHVSVLSDSMCSSCGYVWIRTLFYGWCGVAQCTYLRGQAVHIYVYDDPDNNIHKIRIYMYHIEVITLIKPDWQTFARLILIRYINWFSWSHAIIIINYIIIKELSANSPWLAM